MPESSGGRFDAQPDRGEERSGRRRVLGDRLDGLADADGRSMQIVVVSRNSTSMS